PAAPLLPPAGTAARPRSTARPCGAGSGSPGAPILRSSVRRDLGRGWSGRSSDPADDQRGGGEDDERANQAPHRTRTYFHDLPAGVCAYPPSPRERLERDRQEQAHRVRDGCALARGYVPEAVEGHEQAVGQSGVELVGGVICDADVEL